MLISELDFAYAIPPLKITQQMIDNAGEMGFVDGHCVFGIQSMDKLIVFLKSKNQISAYIAIDIAAQGGFNNLERMNNISAPKGSITALLVFLHKKHNVKYRISSTEPLTDAGKDWLCKIIDQGRGFTITSGNGDVITADDVSKAHDQARKSGRATPMSILIPKIHAANSVTESWLGILQPMIRYLGDSSIE